MMAAHDAFAGTEVRPYTGVRAWIDRPAIETVGRWAVTYSLALIFLWFGALKFGEYETSTIAPLVINSPLISWLNGVLGIGGTSHFLGFYEILTGVLVACRPVIPRLGAIAGAMAAFCFLITVSFLVTTPGVVQPGSANPLALTAMPGQFLLKDVVLLAVSVWVAGGSLVESAIRKATR